jgi:hypothetical protein
MTVLCRQFGVSRKTGYKILNRYNSCDLEGLTDRTPIVRAIDTIQVLSGSNADVIGVCASRVSVSMFCHILVQRGPR